MKYEAASSRINKRREYLGTNTRKIQGMQTISSSQNLIISDEVQGSIEQRTEPYLKYGEGADADANEVIRREKQVLPTFPREH